MEERRIALGLRPNIAQFTLLALNNALVGTMVGLERTVLPILAKESFHLTSASLLLSFIVSFGVVKGLLNLVAGKLADHWGRKPVLLLGWALGIPVPLIVMFAPTWGWILLANVLLGANQGFAWSMTVSSKIDLVGPKNRGMALGINEFSGYVGVALTSGFTAYLASTYGPRPAPFIFGEVIAIAGFLMAWLLIRETLPYAKLESATAGTATKQHSAERLSLGKVIAKVSFQNRTLMNCSQVGMINKLSDTAVWGLVPIVMAEQHFRLTTIGLVGTVYAMTWGVLQLGSGAWSDHVGRKLPIVSGQILNGIGIGLIQWTHGAGMWMLVAFLMGAGTALLYPVLLSAVGDEAHPSWRSSALGVYRMWRDGGYAVGGLLLGIGADWFGIQHVLFGLSVGVLFSGLVAALMMKETLRRSTI